jgi:hypothetical protein
MDLYVMAEVSRQILAAGQLPHATLLGGEEEVTALLRDAAVKRLFLRVARVAGRLTGVSGAAGGAHAGVALA